MNRSETNRYVICALALAFSATGCASLNNTEKGASAGAATGAVLGGVIGANNGSTAKGAILGAVIGGTAGAVIGRQMDKRAEELEASLDGAEVERVGEGIQITFDSGILFDFDSDALRAEAKKNLKELARNADQYQGSELVVVGHTDDVGDADYNARLSTRRAAAARDLLIQNGVNPSLIRAEGRGEMEPITPNTSDAARQENRRVEVAIFASEAYRDQMKQRHGSFQF